jgi:hypothetical protein
MPTYDYRCEANARIVEVRHGMNEIVRDWADLCARAGIEPGDTPGDAEVVRLITGGYVITHTGSGDPMPCGNGPCGSGLCGLE